MNFIKVAQLGTDVREVALNDGATVGDALQAARVSTEGFEIRLNNTPANHQTPVRSGDVVTLVSKIRGGCE